VLLVLNYGGFYRIAVTALNKEGLLKFAGSKEPPYAYFI